MVIINVNHTWQSYMSIIHGNHKCQLYMATINGNHKVKHFKNSLAKNKKTITSQKNQATGESDLYDITNLLGRNWPRRPMFIKTFACNLP